jgi:hypothetical protein
MGVWTWHRKKLSFGLGQHITIAQAEVYATEACTAEDKGYKNRNFHWNDWVFRLCPLSSILKNTFQKLDLFPSSDEGGRHLLY